MGMVKFVVFLCGVNVGGVNFKMVEVVMVLIDVGFCNVCIILVSGNVLLELMCGVVEVCEKIEVMLCE